MIVMGTGLLQLDYDAIPSATAAGIEKSSQSDPHPPGTTRFLNWFHPATLYTGFCSNDRVYCGIQQPPPSFSNRQTGGGLYIFPAGSITAQWAVHRPISPRDETGLMAKGGRTGVMWIAS
jgi:hypothetical protein